MGGFFMSEKLIPKPDLTKFKEESRFITTPDELGNPRQAYNLCAQISGEITKYNTIHPHEMLEKTPQELLDQFQRGLSVIMTHQNGGEPKAIFHATAYPALSDFQAQILGFQVYEAGSVITMPEYRNLGIGKEGSDRLVYVIQDQCSQIPLWCATNKQAKAFLAMTHGAKMVGADYYDFPYLTNLTCTCRNCSELFGFSCQYRRPSAFATPEIFNSIKVMEGNGHMFCTLIVSDIDQSRMFESVCRRKSEQLGLGSVQAGRIDVDIMNQISNFYQKLNEQ